MDHTKEENGMEQFLVSLVGPLMGYYLRVDAKNEDCVRMWAAKTLGPTWCSVYPVDHVFRKEPKIIGDVEEIWNYGEY